jgi:hypothetical protein
MTVRTFSRIALVGLATAEGIFAARRWNCRREAFAAATRRAQELGRPLIVIGDPHAGAHTRLMPAYGCGDLCLDLNGCPRCLRYRAADITQGPIAGIGDDSAVVFVSCVLEYVDDLRAAVAEIARIAGDPRNTFVVTVQPYTFTAALYPGARWAGTTPEAMTPVTTWHKLGASAALAALVFGAVCLKDQP